MEVGSEVRPGQRKARVRSTSWGFVEGLRPEFQSPKSHWRRKDQGLEKKTEDQKDSSMH